jgi:hypothetical protein
MLDTIIPTEDWNAGWSKMSESTASAPGTHYGHYISAAVAAKLPEDHEGYLPDLAVIYPLKHGFAPRRRGKYVDAWAAYSGRTLNNNVVRS